MESPTALDPIVETIQPNENLIILKSDFIIGIKGTIDEKIKINGCIVFSWFPHTEFLLVCESMDIRLLENRELLSTIFEVEYLNDSRFEIRLRRSNIVNYTKGSFEFEIHLPIILGQYSTRIRQYDFVLANFVKERGSVINKNKNHYLGRITFNNKECEIIIDRIHQPKIFNELKKVGGYHITSACKLILHKSFKVNQFYDLCNSLNHFISFINGAWTSIFFMKNDNFLILNKSVIQSYSNSENWYSEVNSNKEAITKLWINFREIWKNNQGKEMLRNVIQWYTEVNVISPNIESRILMAQCCLELLCNYYLEINKIATNNDDIKPTALKIRIVLSAFKIDFSINQNLIFIKEFIKKENKNWDGPTCLVELRNSIVHFSFTKENVRNKVSLDLLHEALNLSLFYIEILLLNLLNYKGNYENRITNRRGEL